MTQLYKLNKDMLVKIITTIEDNHKKELDKYKLENMSEEQLNEMQYKVWHEKEKRFPRIVKGPTGATGAGNYI